MVRGAGRTEARSLMQGCGGRGAFRVSGMRSLPRPQPQEVSSEGASPGLRGNRGRDPGPRIRKCRASPRLLRQSCSFPPRSPPRPRARPREPRRVPAGWRLCGRGGSCWRSRGAGLRPSLPQARGLATSRSCRPASPAAAANSVPSDALADVKSLSLLPAGLYFYVVVFGGGGQQR